MKPKLPPPPGEPFFVMPRHPDMRADHLDADQRMDPYWGRLWNGAAHADFNSWKELSITARDSTDDEMWERDRRHTPELARTTLMNTAHRLHHRRLSCLSVPAMYGVATNQQIAAFIGAPEIALHGADLGLAFAAGLLKRGWPKHSGLARRNSRCPVDLYRPLNGPAVRQIFESKFYEAVYAGVTADHRWPGGSIHPRHDVLAAELALRIAECCWNDITLVLGETEARLDGIATVHEDFTRLREPEKDEDRAGNNDADTSEHPDKSIGQRTADLLLYREDQMPIAVELTANVDGENFAPKLEAWTKLLASRAREDDGCAVVFVEAAHPKHSNSIASRTRKQIREVTTRHGRCTWEEKVSSRLFFARWSDWFPRQNQVSPEAFRRLRVDRLDRGRWRTVELGDSTQVPFSPAADFILDLDARWEARHLSWAIPYWLRNERLALHNARPIVHQRWQARLAELEAEAEETVRRRAARAR